MAGLCDSLIWFAHLFREICGHTEWKSNVLVFFLLVVYSLAAAEWHVWLVSCPTIICEWLSSSQPVSWQVPLETSQLLLTSFPSEVVAVIISLYCHCSSLVRWKFQLLFLFSLNRTGISPCWLCCTHSWACSRQKRHPDSCVIILSSNSVSVKALE